MLRIDYHIHISFMNFKALILSQKLSPSSKIYPGNSSLVFFLIDDLGFMTIHNQQFNEPDAAMDFYVRENAIDTTTGIKHDGWRFWRVLDEARNELVPLEHLRASIQSERVSEIKTSDTHPLRFDSIDWPTSAAKIGLTICPGKQGRGLYSGIWKRDLQKDFDVISGWPTKILITLMESHEFALLHIKDFELKATQQQFEWLHLPIEDMHVPTNKWMNSWPELSLRLRKALEQDQNLVIHCRGGLGRTGIVAALLLIDQKVDNQQAISMVRKVRPGAIETFEQEQFVLNYKKEKL
jgi:protein-tyrosine phosphatase